MDQHTEAGSAEAGPAQAHFVLRREAVIGGVTVPVELGAHSWGRLSPARDNAVLVCHYYTGTMRAAGAGPDGTPGWWDALIGPGRAIDTERYFVVCMNTLSNVQVRDPDVISTGPDSRHPDGEPWGERFPKWDFGDLHALQVELMHELGLARWHAVVGPSLGGIQALHWAARTPELAPRVGAIVTSPAAGPVLRDAFYPLLRGAAASGGLEEALRLISLLGFGGDGLELTFREADFSEYLRGRMAACSLPHLLDIGRAVLTHDLAAVAPQGELFRRWRESGLQLLTVNATVDQFFPVAEMRAFARDSQAAGVQHTHLEFGSPLGHLGCLQAAPELCAGLRELLAAPDARPLPPELAYLPAPESA
ncbi:homoserine O-acetyltransferase [Deinococcus reticulitermitis]|uniref:Homoserine O-acetyltransferase n=1 Tax=Deinococcus reticulitermitis TaxID=856736 RepID=A0A1H7CFY3_9DEIO|nr:alpha/beta fold hydrolase [Deinococcus reticulitermitis]SEJ87507.1 homoserine O-acetyltransferase [Deinococcus reticulitermitis]